MHVRIFAPVTEDLLRKAYAADLALLGHMATRPDIFRAELKQLELALETRGVDPKAIKGEKLSESQAEELRAGFIVCYVDAARAMPRSQLSSLYAGLVIFGYYEFATVFASQMTARSVNYTALNYFKQAISDLDEARAIGAIQSGDDLVLPILFDPADDR